MHFLIVCVSIICLAGGCGQSSSSEATQEFCARLVSCGLATAAETSCHFEMQPIFTFLPTPDDAAKCLKSVPCSELLADPESTVSQCTQLDNARFRCESTNLIACNLANACMTVNCETYCAALGLIGGASCETTGASAAACKCL